MDHAEQQNIRMVVDDEQTLYSTFSPEDEFNESVKSYIRSKAANMDHTKSISLTVIAKEPMDEERFRAAVSSWIRDEKALFRKKQKENVRLLIGSLIFGTILILLSIFIEKQYDVAKYSLLPIMASLALGKAAGILVTDLPLNDAY